MCWISILYSCIAVYMFITARKLPWLPGRNRFLPLEVEETGKNIKKFENRWIGKILGNRAKYKYFSVVFLFTSSIVESENHIGFMEEIGFFHLNLKKLEKKDLKCLEMTGQFIKVIDTAAPTCTVQKLIEILCKFAPSGNVIIGLADWV